MNTEECRKSIDEGSQMSIESVIIIRANALLYSLRKNLFFEFVTWECTFWNEKSRGLEFLIFKSVEISTKQV